MIQKRLRHTAAKSRFVVNKWRHRLKGMPCFIVGNGPSLDKIFIHKLDDYFTIGINRVFKKDNFDPTVLMWQDIDMWITERHTIMKLQAIKLARNVSDPRGISHTFRTVAGEFKLTTDLVTLYGSGATAPLAFQVAIYLDCDPIILVGCDCRYAGGKTNFYGINKFHKQHSMLNCKKGLIWMKRCQTTSRVISCSDDDVFLPENKMTLEDAIEKYSKSYPGKGREYFVGKLFEKS